MSRRAWTIVFLVAALVAALAAALVWRARDEPTARSEGPTLSEALATDTTGYARVTGPVPLAFPRDHGPHPAYKLEWWYFTGNLATDGGRRFGYEFTIFRNALAPTDSTAVRSSDWATNQLYFAHFALTDVEAEAFYYDERFSRGAAGLAGAQARPFRVWLEDWQVEGFGEGVDSLRVTAAASGFALELVLDPVKPVALQGDRGYSRKGPGAGNASTYYSWTRLASTGRVRIGGDTHAVRGLSWMDREWSTSMLTEEQSGWDWFALHLDDGRDLMYYRLRSADPTDTRFDHGIVVAPDGRSETLDGDDVRLEVVDYWTSPHSGARYPSTWRLFVPEEELALLLVPTVRDQELDLTVRYWEGAVEVRRVDDPEALLGHGYIELTGYDAEAGTRGTGGAERR